MTIVMQQFITESLNEGRTTQAFAAGHQYDVPDRIAQLWIGRGWARAVAARDSSPVKREAPANDERRKE
jgi:hypothetical protein